MGSVPLCKLSSLSICKGEEATCLTKSYSKTMSGVHAERPEDWKDQCPGGVGQGGRGSGH